MMSEDIGFVKNNVNEVESILKKGYEDIMKVQVANGDPINDFISWVTYIITIIKEDINFTGKMNLLRYSTGVYLEAIGELVGVKRNEEKGAAATIKYTFSKVFDEIIVIPKGHKVGVGDLYFELDENIELEIGKREIIGHVTCVTEGTIGNGFAVGEINTVIDDIPFLLKVENLTISNGGADREDDESLRERIRLKPTSFSTAGPITAYKYYVLTAHQDIIDTHIYTPEETPGVVKIYPLMKNGKLPEGEILNIIKNTLSDDVRPFTDNVKVETPAAENYNINFRWWIENEEDVNIIKPKMEAALQEYISWQKQKLGRDINPNKLVQLLIQAGVKRVEITSPVFKRLEKTQVAQEQSITSEYQGAEDE